MNKILLCSFQLIREGSSSLLEVLKVFTIASLDVPVDVSFLHFSRFIIIYHHLSEP
jgi:hypothetical protein